MTTRIGRFSSRICSRQNAVASLADRASHIRSDAGLVTFDVPDEKAGARASRFILERGGTLYSLVPVRESLEEIFARIESRHSGHMDAHGERDGNQAPDR